jgi:hypothetical protein
MSDAAQPVKESQIDWLTLTFKEGGKWIAARLAAEHALELEKADGCDEQDLRFQGYSGWQAGRVGFGTRDDGGILRLSGALADEGAADLIPLASNVSRIDVAVTAQLPDGFPNPMLEGFKVGPATPAIHGQRPNYQLIQHSTQGTTLYVGARTSQAFGRCYDKWRQSELAYYAHCVRFELEAKGKLGSRLALALAGDPDRRSSIRATVHDYFSQRGVPCPFDRGCGDLHVASYRPRTDDLSRILWLGRQVKPVIDELRSRGRMADIAAALGVTLHQ